MEKKMVVKSVKTRWQDDEFIFADVKEFVERNFNYKVEMKDGYIIFHGVNVNREDTEFLIWIEGEITQGALIPMCDFDL